MDNWKKREAYIMEIGGNKRFKDFLKKYNISKPTYREEELNIFKLELQNEADQKFNKSSNQ